jgi:gluconolactonase
MTLRVLFLAVLAAWSVYGQAAQDWTLIGRGYQLTADSTVDPQGNVYFTDARTNRILKVDLKGAISGWKEGSNGAHGVAFGPDGRLYAAQQGLKRIVAFSADGTESLIAEGIPTHHLTVTSRNQVYATEAPAHKVWLIEPGGRTRVVHEGLKWPRGVRPSNDQSHLLVNDPQANEVWSFRILKDGSLADGRPMYHTGADPGGMTLDSRGFLYVAGQSGVQVFDTSGRLTTTIPPPGKEGLNGVLFGGPWLYVLDTESLYRRPANR